MKKQIIFLTIVLSIFPAMFANAETVLRDTFNNISSVGDVNTDTNAVGRQFGTLAPIDYAIKDVVGTITEVGSSATYPDQLMFIENQAACSPNDTFMESDNYTVEFDVVKPPQAAGGWWLSVSFGRDVQNLWVNEPSGMGVILRGGAACGIFDDGVHQGEFPVAGMLNPPYHVLVSYSMDDSSSATAAIFINGQPIRLGAVVSNGTGNPFIYRGNSGFDNNYIGLFNLDGGSTSVVDNFTITATKSKFFEYDWTDDASSKISSGKTYTHTINLGADSDVVINGVNFTGSSSNYNGTGWSMINGFGNNNFQTLSVGGTTISGDSANLVSDFIYEGYAQSSAIILSNLVGGQTYAFTLYNRGYGAGLRESFFAPGDSESAMVILNQNVSGPSGKLVKYYYTAPSNGVFSIALSTAVNAGWHYYAFSNEESAGPPVGNISASQGTYSDKIAVIWDNVDGADKYQVYRNTTADSSTAITVSPELTTNAFDDTTATVNLDYYYWVKAGNTNGWSEFGDYAMGFSTDSTGPDTPVNQLPVDDAMVDFPVTLEGSAYSDPGSWSMISIQWQIDDKTNFSSMTWDTGEINTNATSIEVPTSVLGLTNYWRVRYRNDKNAWSEWSVPTSFRTERDSNSPFYFYDTFNNVSGSGNVNKDYTASGRQYGRVIPVDYSFTGTTVIGDGAANPNELTLSDAGSACSPNWSFEESTNFMVDVKIKPSVNGAAVTFGKTSQNLPANSAGGFGVIFYGGGSGIYDVYNSSTLVGTFTNDIIKSSELHVLLTASTADFENELAYIAMTVNDSPIILRRQFIPDADTNFNRWGFFYAYEKASGFDGNYITLYNYGGDSIFDDLKVSIIKAKFSTRTWENDDDTWIGLSNSVADFTHAVNINLDENVFVNSLDFIGSGLATNWLTPDTYSAASGTNWSLFGANGLMAWWSQDAPFAGDSGKILEGGIYGWSSSVGVTLSNLIPDSVNILNIYGYPFATVNARISYLSGSDGGVFEVDENADPDKGQIIEYEYTAGSDGTFTFTFTPKPNMDYFLYGFSSYLKDVPEPEIDVVEALDFGEVVVSGSKSMSLDIFNVGSGVVSGNVSFATVDSFFSVSTNYYYSTQEFPDTIEVMFQPDEEIDYSNTLYLTGSGTNGVVEVTLTGTGIPEPIGIWIIGNLFLLFFWKSKNKFRIGR